MSTPYFVPPLEKKWGSKKKILLASLAEFFPHFQQNRADAPVSVGRRGHRLWYGEV